MKYIIKKVKENRLLFILLGVMLLSILFGILFLAIQSSNIKVEIKDNLDSIIQTINNNKYNSLIVFSKSIKTNVLSSVLVWLLGISILGIPLILLVFIIRCIMIGFTITSFIYVYKFEGIIRGFIYIIPYIISAFILFILVYYAIRFSILIFNSIFRKKDFNKRVVVKRYVKVFIISFILLLITSLIEAYVIPMILRLIFF